jgi:glycosyltransferase involved in cell wall biosynthesis
MSGKAHYLFLKQSAQYRSYFGELCLDVPHPDEFAVVYSEIDAGAKGNVQFCTGPGYRRESFRSRILSWLKYFMAALRFSLCYEGRPLLFIVAQPPILPLLGYLEKKILGRSYVVWVDDIYPDVLIRRGVLKRSGLVARLWRVFNRITLGDADHIFTLSPQMLGTLQQYLSPDIPASVIPTWVDTEAVHPVPKACNPWALKHGLADKLTILYSGNFGDTHDLEPLLTAARQLRNQSDLRFVFIGTGHKWEALRKSVAENGDTNIMVLPWQPAEVLTQSLASADIAFVSLGKGVEGISMPSKTYYAMSAGSAILASCSEQSDLDLLVKRFACGVSVRPRSVSELVAAIENLSGNLHILRSCQANARAAAVEHYSRPKNVPLIREALAAIPGRSSREIREQEPASKPVQPPYSTSLPDIE